MTALTGFFTAISYLESSLLLRLDETSDQFMKGMIDLNELIYWNIKLGGKFTD